MDRTSVFIDREMRDKMTPYLRKRGFTFSSWLRVKMDAFLEEQERIAAGKTQINPAAINHDAA